MREIPTLKELYNKYGGDHFQILGVAVWDQRDNSMRAIKEHGITWPQIVNAGTIPTELYGIKGIPQIMLFAPDGTIVARDLRGEEMVALIEQEMAKYQSDKK